MQALTAQPLSGDGALAAFWYRQQTQLTAVLDRLVVPGSRVLYLDYPVYSNVGDLLIYHGTENWLSARGHDVFGRASILDCRFPEIPDDVVIVCQGGGNFGDLYRHQRFREAVVAGYPGNRIVFLPQTVHYESPDAIAESRRRLAAHDDLHLVLREHRSLALAQQYFPDCRTYLAPDMAVMLYPLAAGTQNAGAGPRLCLFRQDAERTPAPKPGIGRCDWQGDWKRMLGRRYIALRLLQGGIMLAGRGAPAAATARLWRAFTHRIITHCAAVMRAAACVETSRLHGHILASLLGVPNRLHDNSYGKNSAYYRTWHAQMPLSGRTLA